METDNQPQKTEGGLNNSYINGDGQHNQITSQNQIASTNMQGRSSIQVNYPQNTAPQSSTARFLNPTNKMAIQGPPNRSSQNVHNIINQRNYNQNENVAMRNTYNPTVTPVSVPVPSTYVTGLEFKPRTQEINFKESTSKPMKTSKEYWQHWYKVNKDHGEGRLQQKDHFDRLFSRQEFKAVQVENLTLDEIFTIHHNSPIVAYTMNNKQQVAYGDITSNSMKSKIISTDNTMQVSHLKFNEKGDILFAALYSKASQTSSVFIIPYRQEDNKLDIDACQTISGIPAQVLALSHHTNSNTLLVLLTDSANFYNLDVKNEVTIFKINNLPHHLCSIGVSFEIEHLYFQRIDSNLKELWIVVKIGMEVNSISVIDHEKLSNTELPDFSMWSSKISYCLENTSDDLLCLDYSGLSSLRPTPIYSNGRYPNMYRSRLIKSYPEICGMNSSLSIYVNRTNNLIEYRDIRTKDLFIELNLNQNSKVHINKNLNVIIGHSLNQLIVHSFSSESHQIKRSPINNLQNARIISPLTLADNKYLSFYVNSQNKSQPLSQHLIDLNTGAHITRSVTLPSKANDPPQPQAVYLVEKVECISKEHVLISRMNPPSIACLNILDWTEQCSIDTSGTIAYSISRGGERLVTIGGECEVKVYKTQNGKLDYENHIDMKVKNIVGSNIMLDIDETTVCIFFIDTFYWIDTEDSTKKFTSIKLEEHYASIDPNKDSMCLLYEGTCALYCSSKNNKIGIIRNYLSKKNSKGTKVRRYLEIDAEILLVTDIRSQVSKDFNNLIFFDNSKIVKGKLSVYHMDLSIKYINNSMRTTVSEGKMSNDEGPFIVQYTDDKQFILISQGRFMIIYSIFSKLPVYNVDGLSGGIQYSVLNNYDISMIYNDGSVQKVSIKKVLIAIFTDFIGINMMKYNEYIDKKEKKQIFDRLLKIMELVPISNIILDNIYSDMIVNLDNEEILMKFIDLVGLENAIYYCGMIQSSIVNQKLNIIRGLITRIDDYRTKNKGRIPNINQKEIVSLFNQNSKYYNSTESQDLILRIMFNQYKTVDMGLQDEELYFLDLNAVPTVYYCPREERIEDARIYLRDSCPSNIEKMNVHVCEIPLHLDNGSEFSINFFPVLKNMPDHYLEKFFSAIVYYKWKKVNTYARWYAGIYSIMNLFSYLYLTVFLQNTFLYVCIVVLCSLFLLFEVKCFLSSKSNYFSTASFKNTFDVSVLILNIVCCTTIQSSSSTTSEESTMRYIHILRIVTLVALCWRGAIVLYCFKGFRYLISMILQVILDIKYFIILIIYVSCYYGALWRMIPTVIDGVYGEEEDSIWTSILTGGTIAMSGYENDSENNTFQHIVAIIGGIFLGLVMQNFLISLISDTYSEVKENRGVTDVKSIIDLIFDWDCFLKGIQVADTEYDMMYLLPCDDAENEGYGKIEKRLEDIEVNVKKIDKVIEMLKNSQIRYYQ